jgi:type IV secretory pathway VirB2 component (pilin)
MPIDHVLCTLSGWAAGSTGNGIETLSIIMLGLLALFGKLSWEKALIDVAAVAAIHSAGAIVQSLGASVATGCEILL